MDLSKLTNIEVDGIDTSDYPKFCDAFIASADYNGKPLTDKELDKLNEDSDFVHSCVEDSIY
tara:strand:+ start:1302 stop:1487 length:186 start_codon:yes stop_codon:yes gene_type:complete